jgi:hypothetical protein
VVFVLIPHRPARVVNAPQTANAISLGNPRIVVCQAHAIIPQVFALLQEIRLVVVIAIAALEAAVIIVNAMDQLIV